MGREMTRQNPLRSRLSLMRDPLRVTRRVWNGQSFAKGVNTTLRCAPMRDGKVATSIKIVPDGVASVALCVNALNSLAVVPSLLQRPALPPAPRNRYNGTIMNFYRRVTCAND
jgi:hypothetical protein